MDHQEENPAMMTPAKTLVHYQNPILVRDARGPVKRQVMKTGGPFLAPPTGFPQAPNIPGLGHGSSGGQDRDLSKEEMVDIIESIFPTKEWIEGDQREDQKVWQQKISSTPASRFEVTTLEEELDMRLKQQQVRSGGISPVRHHLYAQAFDELIRQVTIDNGERGLLLVRIREESRMTIATYETLYEHAINYGLHNANKADAMLKELETEIAKLEEEGQELENTFQSLKIQMDLGERGQLEKKKSWDKRFTDEISLIKRSNLQLKMLLDNVTKK